MFKLESHLDERALDQIYEKSDPACDSRAALLRGIQAVLPILSKSFFDLFLKSECCNHLFARSAHSRSRSEACPFTHPTEQGQWVLGLTNQKDLRSTWTRDFYRI
jgi:hypothetical protein